MKTENACKRCGCINTLDSSNLIRKDVYTADKKFSVEVAENTSEEERSAVVKVTCGDKSVDLVVNQSKSTQLRKIKDAFGGLFKKKKK